MLTRNLACVLLLVLLPILLAATVLTQPTAPTTPKLVLSLRYNAGMADPRSGQSSGCVLAAWDDGVVVFATDPHKGGRDMQFGRVTPEQLGRVLADLAGAGFFAKVPGGGTAPDDAYHLLWASRDGERASYYCTWDEGLFGRPGVSADADDRDRGFARMWALSRVAVSFAYPSRASRRPVEDDPAILRRLSKATGSYEPRADQP